MLIVRVAYFCAQRIKQLPRHTHLGGTANFSRPGISVFGLSLGHGIGGSVRHRIEGTLKRVYSHVNLACNINEAMNNEKNSERSQRAFACSNRFTRISLQKQQQQTVKELKFKANAAKETSAKNCTARTTVRMRNQH